MSSFLNTKQISVPQVTPPTTTPPPLSIPFVKPESYEFRVVEHLDTVNNKITKVCLQVQTYDYDEYGTPTLKINWTDIPRVQVDSETGLIIPK